MIVSLETTRHILVAPTPALDSPAQDPFGREPFQHPALANVDKLSARQPRHIASQDRLANLAIDVGLPEVVRWKPRMVM
jgi:large subunit ribosomal protein L15